MSIHLKDIAGAIFEEEPQKPHPQVPAAPQFIHQSPVVMTNVGVPPAPSVTMTIPTEPIDHDDDMYQRLLGKTDFSQSQPVQILNKYLAPLASSGLDDKTKFGIAIKQAAAIDHLDPATINAVFEQCKQQLASATDSFKQTVAAKTTLDVDAKNKQAADLQAQAQQLTEAAFAAKQKLDTAQHKFDVASQTRLNEINQEQAKYANLLA